MSDKKSKPGPMVEVVRKPAGSVAPVAPRPAPVPVPVPVRPAVVAPRPTGVTPSARPVSPSAGPRPSSAPGGRSGSPRPSGPGGFRGPPRPRAPRPPPTPEQIIELAQREHVPARIAKGDLEGKMKCRIWRKLHAEEAARFDQAYALMGKTPGLELAEAFGINQSGLSVEEFRARRARMKKKESIKAARAAVDGAPIDAFIQGLIDEKAELSLVLGESTVLDAITEVRPVSFTLERAGRLEKLNVVCLARKGVWEPLAPGLPRESRLSQKPQQVARQPSRRPVSDPQPFVERIGQDVTLQLRNGIELKLPLLAVGPFDVLLGEAGEEIFVPLHAMLSWS